MTATQTIVERLATEKIVSALEGCLTLIDDMSRFVGQMSLKDYALFNSAPIDARRAIAALSAPQRQISFDPLKGGCPQCKWETGNLGTMLIEKCDLHQKIEDLMADGMTDKMCLADYHRQDDRLREIAGIDPEEDVIQPIRECFESVGKAKAEIERLTAELDKAREALKPFADHARDYTLSSDYDIVASRSRGAAGWGKILVGDLRKARDAVEGK